MNPSDQADRNLDVELARLESTTAAHPTRVLVTAAMCAVVIGALALFLDWQSAVSDEGVATRVGWSAAPFIVAVMVTAALLLLAMAWWRTEQPAWSGWAAAASAIAALGYISGVRAGQGEDNFSGPAGWIGLAAFGAAAVLAALAAMESSRRPRYVGRVPDTLLESTIERIKIVSAGDEPVDKH